MERNDANPAISDKYGYIPLLFAPANRHPGLTRMLRELDDVNTNTADGYGQTPLSQAAKNRNRSDRILELFRGRQDSIIGYSTKQALNQQSPFPPSHLRYLNPLSKGPASPNIQNKTRLFSSHPPHIPS